MEVRLLGPLELVDRDRTIELPGGRPRALLALLLLEARGVVSTERLIDGLWGSAPPATAAKIVQGYVSRLRRVLPPGVLETRPPGYVLRVRERETDAGRFEGLRRRGEAAVRDGRLEEGARLLREAVSLWRGPALADVAGELWPQGELARLEERRLTTLEALFEAELALGREAQVIGGLEALTVEHPLRERPRAQLMLARYRAGRQADALDVYRDLGRRLSDELGLEPGPELRELQRMILAHDPALMPAPGPAVSPPVTERPSHPGRRRMVTVLSCDVTESTLADVTGPEALQARLERAADRLRTAVARHGGTLEPVGGDVLTAVFGLPTAHEDDAPRALRASLDAQTLLAGEAVSARMGVASGEIVAGAGPPRQPAMGAPVHAAARLARAAPPRVVLLDRLTAELAREEIEAVPFEPAELHLGAELTLRLLSVAPRRPWRPLAAPLVGRELELRTLAEAFARVEEAGRGEVVTVVGAAGVGKSRLARELLRRMDAHAVTGRCLSYGEGITYWPVLEMVEQLEPWVDGLDAGARNALAVLRGRDGATSADALAWSLRSLLEAAAVDRPLVVVADDLQWAETAFLDLVEYIGLMAAGPILLLCLARPELLERRATWPGVLRLDPLASADIERVMDERLEVAGRDLPPASREAIVTRAGGNPLFAREMTSMLLEAPGSERSMPPTVASVLAARLDQLGEGERLLLEAAAVEGEEFHAGILAVLDDEDRELTSSLTLLVRRELIRPAGSHPELGDRFRFHHALVRDAAYAVTATPRRAELHERLAGWVEGRAERVPEHDGLAGYHLEQAYRYRSALAPDDGAVRALGGRAAARLAAAGRHALGRADVEAATGLLRRAVDVDAAAGRPIGLELELDLADALSDNGRLEEAREVLDRARAHRALDRREELLLRLAVAGIDLATAPEGVTARLERLGRDAVPLFADAGDDSGLARAWSARAVALHMRALYARRNEAFARAAVHARRAGDEHRAREVEGMVAAGHLWGPTPVPDALAWLDEHRYLEHEPVVIGVRAVLMAMAGRLEEARALAQQEMVRSRELGTQYERGSFFAEHFIELLVGDVATAAEHARAHCEMLERMGERTVLSTRAAQLAEDLCTLGRDDEAEHWARRAEELGARDDVLTQILWRQAIARVLAHRGQTDEAISLARDAVRRAARTDALDEQGDVHLDLAEVLERAGEVAEAAAAASEALERYERKGNVVMAERASRRLAALQAGLDRPNPVVR